MGEVSFAERFELLELLREDGPQGEQVQTFRARERVSGRVMEAHFSEFPEGLAKLESVIDRGSLEGKLYVVTAPQGLDSAGAWRVTPPPAVPSIQPAPAAPQQPAAEPGDFTRMFQLRQAPEPVAAPSAKPQTIVTHASSEPGEFTRAFQRPERTPSAAPTGSSEPGQPGDFTRMFQKPVPAPPAQPAPEAVEGSVSAAPTRIRVAVIVIAILIVAAIGVFVLVRTLY
jgi:hypothetical protein